MADTPRAYKLNKEKRAADENGKFLYYFYDRKKLTSVALPEEQFDKLVEMDREYYNLERRENDHKTTFKKSANANGYKKIDIEKDDFGQASEDDSDDDDVSGADFTYKIHKQCDIDKTRDNCKTNWQYPSVPQRAADIKTYPTEYLRRHPYGIYAEISPTGHLRDPRRFCFPAMRRRFSSTVLRRNLAFFRVLPQFPPV